jgi:hypothetical protein
MANIEMQTLNGKPRLIEFLSIGDSSIGYISVAEEQKNVPFEILRVYWTYYTPQSVERGDHANIDKELILVAVAGSIIVETETIDGEKNIFELSKPNVGLFLPKLCWHKMKYSHNAVQMVLASNYFDSLDYIRDYKNFLQYKEKQ